MDRSSQRMTELHKRMPKIIFQSRPGHSRKKPKVRPQKSGWIILRTLENLVSMGRDKLWRTEGML